MPTLLYWTQIISAVLLTLAILLQHKSAGLSATFGGSSNAYSSKRGLDKMLASGTVFFAIIFFGVAIAAIFV